MLWAGIVCLLDAALLQCTLAGNDIAQREVLKYFSDCVFPERLHYIFGFLHGAPLHANACVVNVEIEPVVNLGLALGRARHHATSACFGSEQRHAPYGKYPECCHAVLAYCVRGVCKSLSLWKKQRWSLKLPCLHPSHTCCKGIRFDAQHYGQASAEL